MLWLARYLLGSVDDAISVKSLRRVGQTQDDAAIERSRGGI